MRLPGHLGRCDSWNMRARDPVHHRLPSFPRADRDRGGLARKAEPEVAAARSSFARSGGLVGELSGRAQSSPSLKSRNARSTRFMNARPPEVNSNGSAGQSYAHGTSTCPAPLSQSPRSQGYSAFSGGGRQRKGGRRPCGVLRTNRRLRNYADFPPALVACAAGAVAQSPIG
jgi:hypothetical protein